MFTTPDTGMHLGWVWTYWGDQNETFKYFVIAAFVERLVL